MKPIYFTTSTTSGLELYLNVSIHWSLSKRNAVLCRAFDRVYSGCASAFMGVRRMVGY